MNIFVLDKDPKKAAEFHCDKHVVKMILEAGQMMCSSHWLWNLKSLNKSLKDFKRVRDAKAFIVENTDERYLPPWTMTHIRHPCTLWTAENTGNYAWHAELMRGLLDEYTRRYQKNHKSESVYEWLVKNKPRNMVEGMKTDHPQCMPDDCKVDGNTLKAYRNYYNKHKAYMAKWNKLGNVPSWYTGELSV